MSPRVTTAMDVVLALELKPHPEGGYFRETFRDQRLLEGGRAASTAIYFLLARGQRSHWHRVDAVETWHFYAGDPLILDVTASDSGAVTRITVGPDIMAGQRPQAIVPAGAWQAAESLGLWTLVGCTVAPGFTFEGFELAPEGWRPSEATAATPSTGRRSP
jgi:predicted cupin superfamily sugar epimerase